MKLILHLGKYFGIPVNVHWSFIFLPLVTIYWAVTKGANTETIFLLLGLVFLIFICVVLHEFGHALMAKRYGVKTKDIILLPICGMARLERLPERPLHELFVALAGPLVNLIIAMIVAVSLFFVPRVSSTVIEELSNARINIISIPFILVAFNLAMVVFNLFPIFPMDGGRILRSLLAMKFQQSQATKWASYIGQFFSVLLVVCGLWIGDYLLAITGVFVFYLAAREYRIKAHNDYMNATSLIEVMNTDFITLEESAPIPLVKNQIIQTEEDFFLVVDTKDIICGYVSRAAIENAAPSDSIKNLLSHIPEGPPIDGSLSDVTDLFRQYRVPILPVMKEGKLHAVIEIS